MNNQTSPVGEDAGLPAPVAHASKGEHAFFVKWTELGKPLRGNGIALYTAEQVRQAQRDAVAADRARRPKCEMPPEMKAAIDEAHKAGATSALLPNGSAVFINYGHDYGDNSHLECTACGGSGHIEDQRALAAPTQPKAQGSIEDYAQFHILHGAWMSARDYWQDDTAEPVTEAWRKFIDYIDAWTGSRAGDAVPDGWKLVPIEPTERMRQAAASFGHPGDTTYPSGYSKQRGDEAVESYCHMLAAAPAPGKQAGNDQEGA